MKKSLIITAAAVAVLSPSTAFAQSTFTGPRVEARAGFDIVGIDIKDERDFGGRGSFGGSSSNSDFTIGAEAGFDVQFSRVIVGGYVGYDRTGAEETFERSGVTFESKRNITVGARFGGLVSPTVFLYGKGGYSNGRFKPEFASTPTTAAVPFADFSKNRDGIHIGAGAELAVTQRAYFRGDYTHTRYENEDLENFGVNRSTRELRFTRNQFTIGAGFRF